MEDYDELRKEVFQKKVQDIFFKKKFNLKRY
jgi:hypothetical protein